MHRILRQALWLAAALALSGASVALAADAPGQFVTALASDRAGNCWVGAESEAENDAPVIRIDGKTGARTVFTAKEVGAKNIYALCVDGLGRIWAGTGCAGVSVYVEGTGWKNYDVPDGPVGERIFSIACSPLDGSVWLATSGGLTRFTDPGTWTHFTRYDGLPADDIQSLAFDARGTLFCGTQCDSLAVSDAAGGYKTWRHVVGSDMLPLAAAGGGLPSNMINQVIVGRSGLVYVATNRGLAASKDRGRTFAFIRGADWGDKVKGLYGGAPQGWQALPAKLLLTEDFCTAVCEDAAGRLFIGHRGTGFEVIDPGTLERLYASDPKQSGQDYAFAILARPNRAPLIGWYGAGVSEAPAALADKTGKPAVAVPAVPAPPNFKFGEGPGFGAPAPPVTHPTPAGPPTLDELNALLAKLGTVPTLKSLPPTVVEVPDDWRTQGDWLGRYGRYWACLCAIDSPQDYIWGAGPEPIKYAAYMGPNHPQPNDSLRYWVHWLDTENPRCLEMPPTYLDSRIQKGLTTPDRNRRQSEWDDHGETMLTSLDGPDVFCTLKIPSGQFYLSLYDFNKDGHDAKNRFRDFRISIRNHRADLPLENISDFPRQQELAAGRIHDFWGGVWKRFYVQGPIDVTIRVARNNSHNTILAGVMLDYVDERPVPYFCTLDEWEKQMADLGKSRAALLAESKSARAGHFQPATDAANAADRLFDELERVRLRNTPWGASGSRRYYLALARLYAVPRLFSDARRVGLRLATCYYQLRLFPQWEDLQRRDKLTPARDIEKAIRWDGFASTNSGFGYRNVLRVQRRIEFAAKSRVPLLPSLNDPN